MKAATTDASTVHVIDDHGPSRKRLRAVLEQQGYIVVASGAAAAARRLLTVEAPDLVLVDLRTDAQTPGENGYELLAWMRSQPALAQVPVICVTAPVSSAEGERVRAAGFAQFVAKPITPPRRLLDAVRQALMR